MRPFVQISKFAPAHAHACFGGGLLLGKQANVAGVPDLDPRKIVVVGLGVRLGRIPVLGASPVSSPSPPAPSCITLLGAVDGIVASVTADPAYDTIAFYDASTEHGAKVVVPPAKTARRSRRRPRSRARYRTIRMVTNMGRRRWKKETGYHRQARVENAFFRYKSILGDRLRGRTRVAQDVESVLACNVLNRMTELGRPQSFAIAR